MSPDSRRARSPDCRTTFLLAFPLPIPLTNTLPGYAIMLLAASMMEGDGILVWHGDVVAAGTTVYFAFWAKAAASMLNRHFEQLMNLLGVHP